MPIKLSSFKTPKFLRLIVSREEGMTFIELILVLSIMAITFGIVFPIWSRYSANQIIKTEAEKLNDDIRLARNKAINNEQGAYAPPASTESIIGYYIYAPNAPQLTDATAPPAGGLTSYEIRSLKQNKTTLVKSSEVFKTVNFVNNIKLYRGQITLIDSVLYALPFGAVKFYAGDPISGTLVTSSSPCTDNGSVCDMFKILKTGTADYYYHVEVSQNGLVLQNKEP